MCLTWQNSGIIDRRAWLSEEGKEAELGEEIKARAAYKASVVM